MLDIGIKETTTTSGTGAITLVSAAGYARLTAAFQVGDPVTYSLVNGNNFETGIGTVAAGNTMTRDMVLRTFVGGVLTDGGSAINLSGASDLFVTEHHASPIGDCGYVHTGVGQRWVPTAANGTNLATLTATANRGYFMPFAPSFVATAFDSMGIEVSSGVAGTAFVALFESKLVAGKLLPGRRIAQTAALDTTTVGEKLATGLALRLKSGHLYWFGVTCSAAAAVRAVTPAGCGTLLGFINAGTTARTHIYATQSGAFGADASGLSFTAGLSNAPAPVLGV